MSSPPKLTTRAYAKLNLGLEVVNRRPDGFHEIVTIMQTISLADVLTWSPTTPHFSYFGPANVPEDRDLVRMALYSATELPRIRGTLRLDKHIPIAAGLGGGSADAAVALRLAHPNAEHVELEARALRLGSDVPFLIQGGTVQATGRGERFDRLHTPPNWFVVVTPDVWIPGKTQRMYRGLTESDFSDGSSVRSLVDQLDTGLPTGTSLPNAFERQIRMHPTIDRTKQLMHDLTGLPVNISGAGPSLYIIFGNELDARSVADELAEHDLLPSIAETVPANYGIAATQRIANAMRGDPEE